MQQDYPFEDQFQEEKPHLSEYFMVLSKRKVLIIAFFIITVSITMLVTFLMEPVYMASAKLIIDKETSSSPITGERTDFETYQSQAMTFNTHFKLVLSRPVISQLVTTLNLDNENIRDDIEINPIKEVMDQFKENVKLLLKIEKEELAPHEQKQMLMDKIKEKIKIKQIRDTRLLTIDIKDKNSILATDMANTLAKKYIEFNRSSKMESSKQALEWLNNELYELRKKLEDAEKKFFEYKQENKVFSIKGKQKMAEQKIGEFNNKYLETRNRRLGLDAKINELTQNLQGAKEVANIRSLIENPIIDTIYAKIVDLELEKTRLSKIYKSKHPKTLQINSELTRSKKRLDHEIKKEFKNLKSERKVLSAREKTLEKTISEFESDALDSSTKELKYTILQRNVNTSQNLYDLMVSRVKESNVLQTSNTSNIRLVEKAVIPIDPVSPNKKLNLLLSMIIGLITGAGLAFFLEYLDQTIRTEEDIQNHFNIPVLSVIPEAET